MAIQLSNEMAEGVRKYPIDSHGKLRMAFFSVSALAVAYAQNDQIDLCKLPPGRKRLLPNLSRFTGSAFGASRTLHIGHRAYMARPVAQAAMEAENATALVNALDVSGALASVVWSTVMKYDIYSLDEVVLFASINGGTMPIAASLSGFVTYVYE